MTYHTDSSLIVCDGAFRVSRHHYTSLVVSSAVSSILIDLPSSSFAPSFRSFSPRAGGSESRRPFIQPISRSEQHTLLDLSYGLDGRRRPMSSGFSPLPQRDDQVAHRRSIGWPVPSRGDESPTTTGLDQGTFRAAKRRPLRVFRTPRSRDNPIPWPRTLRAPFDPSPGWRRASPARTPIACAGFDRCRVRVRARNIRG